MKNIFDHIPEKLNEEVFDCLVASDQVRIERIISKGHTSPESGWYDQKQKEWVIVLKGEAVIEFIDNSQVKLKTGNYLNIDAHQMHRVTWTKPDSETIWLAVHY